MATEPKKREFVVKSSINVKSMGDPRRLAANLEHDGMKAVLGTIIGIAQGVNRRTDQKSGADYFGLVGSFLAMPADVEREEVRSTICYLPDAVHGPIAAAIEKMHETDPTAVVRFAMEASVQKGGTAGFTWEYKPMIDGPAGQAMDPLAEIKTAISGGQKSLPAQTATEKAALAAQANVTAPNRFDQQRAATTAQVAKPEPERGAARK